MVLVAFGVREYNPLVGDFYGRFVKYELRAFYLGVFLFLLPIMPYCNLIS